MLSAGRTSSTENFDALHHVHAELDAPSLEVARGGGKVRPLEQMLRF